MGSAYYAGNLHKWLGAPSGAAFLWVRPDRQAGIHPTTISHFLGEGLAAEFNWQGTRDITPWLTVPTAIAWFAERGWERIRAHNHQMATWAQGMLCNRWQVEPTTPLDGSMITSMATVPVPAHVPRAGTAEALRDRIYHEHRIEVPVFEWDERWWIRVSAQVYNRAEDYERLADVVSRLG